MSTPEPEYEPDERPSWRERFSDFVWWVSTLPRIVIRIVLTLAALAVLPFVWMGYQAIEKNYGEEGVERLVKIAGFAFIGLVAAIVVWGWVRMLRKSG